MTTWTVETVQALAKELQYISVRLRSIYERKAIDQAIDGVISAASCQVDNAASAITWALERIKEADGKREKIAPVQGYEAGIPWSLHLEAYSAYVKRFGRQDALIDLERRNCRGGFHTSELDEFIPGWRDRVSEITRLKAERDAANARAERARNAALADGVKWIRGQMNDDDSDEYSAGYNDGLKAAAMLLSSAPLREELGRALKEAGK